ncbi:MAG: hypothetical protein ACREV6_22080 [Clostridium sp.]|uniref:hypothetical protein n=1 Tax=Clostridium sp. TaxID=1506 RepID=UPI003D6D891F
MVDIRLILKIEKALGFNLNIMQSKYLFTKELCSWYGRKTGYTTAYIVNLALSTNIEIKLSDLVRGKYNDEFHGSDYNSWFKHEFLKIRDKLSIVGLPVIKIIK